MSCPISSTPADVDDWGKSIGLQIQGADRISDARGRAWLAWLVGGATANGLATWSMHYTGMLAFHLPVPVQYDWPTVLLSLLVAIIGSGAAFLIVSRSKIGWARALAASIFMGGLGISGMHYTAMAAMRLQGIQHHSPALMSLSSALAIMICFIALSLSYLFPDDSPGRNLRHHGGALLTGAANPVMHYTAMAGASFSFSSLVPDLAHTVRISSVGILGISIVPVMVLVVALLTSLADRLQKQRALLDELFEQAPEAVALLNADNRVVRVNRGFTRLFGYTSSETVGRPLSDLIVPEESREEVQKYVDSAAHGQRVETEGIRRRQDGTRLRVSMVRVPVCIPGGQIAVYAMFQDITERQRAETQLRHSREQLRALSGRLESLREGERIRISREIHDELGQKITGLKMDLLWAEKNLGELESSSAVNKLLDRVVGATELVDEIIVTVQEIAAELRPGVLDKLGLGMALQYEARRFQERTGSP